MAHSWCGRLPSLLIPASMLFFGSGARGADRAADRGAGSLRAIVLFTAGSVALAVFGYDSIHSAQRWLAYALIACMIVFCGGVGFLGVPVGNLGVASFQAVPFLDSTLRLDCLSVELVYLCVGLFPLTCPPIVGRPAVILVDVLRAVGPGGAWMMGVGATVAAIESARGGRVRSAPRSGGQHFRRFRHCVTDCIVGGTVDDHGTQFLWRLSHTAERDRHGESPGFHRVDRAQQCERGAIKIECRGRQQSRQRCNQ